LASCAAVPGRTAGTIAQGPRSPAEPRARRGSDIGGAASGRPIPAEALVESKPARPAVRIDRPPDNLGSLAHTPVLADDRHNEGMGYESDTSRPGEP
jgi:hypothetical protein